MQRPNRGTPWNRLRRAAGVAPCKGGVWRSTRSERSLGVSHYFKRLTQMEMTFGDTLHHLGEVSDRMQDSAGVFA